MFILIIYQSCVEELSKESIINFQNRRNIEMHPIDLQNQKWECGREMGKTDEKDNV